jgi:hypothetical protein
MIAGDVVVILNKWIIIHLSSPLYNRGLFTNYLYTLLD